MPDDARLAALEARVAALESELARLHARAPLSAVTSRPVRGASPPPLSHPQGVVGTALRSDDLVGKLGIGLLLVGVAFLLKWSIDQGFLTPLVRVGGAALLGAVLVAAGVRLRTSRGALASLLAGGGVAVLFGSLFAGALLYGFVGTGTAFALAAVLTAASYALSVRARLPLLAPVATLGALGFPVVLYEPPHALPLALGFAALVLVGGAALWHRTGWRGLLVALAAGGWTALALLRYKAGPLSGTERMAMQLAVVVAWAAVGLVPLLRHGLATMSGAWTRVHALFQPEALALWTSAVAAYTLTSILWPLGGGAGQGALALALAVAYGIAAHRTRSAHAEALFTASAGLVLAGVYHGAPETMRPGLWVLATALAATYARRRTWTAAADVAEGAALVALVVAVVYATFETSPTGAGALALLLGAAAVFALVAGGQGRAGLRRNRRARPFALLVGAHALVLAALRYAFHEAAQGAALVSGTWGLYAVALVVAGIRRRRDDVRLMGLSTLALTVGKMLLFDIRALPMEARVVIFVGLGLLLLAVNYAAPHLLRGRSASPGGAPGADAPKAGPLEAQAPDGPVQPPPSP